MTIDPDRLNENIHDGVSFVGLRALGDVDKETGRVTNMQLLGVSIVASPTEEYARVPSMSPRRGKSVVDQMAFLPTIDMEKPSFFGLDSGEGKDNSYYVLMHADRTISDISQNFPRTEEMRYAVLEDSKAQLGISEELLNEKETYSMAAEHLKHIYAHQQFVYTARRAGKASGLVALRAGIFPNIFTTLPLGAETALYRKRTFDYELIGGL